MDSKTPRDLVLLPGTGGDGLYVREISSRVTLFVVNKPTLLPVEPKRSLLRVLDRHCRLDVNQRIVSASAGMEVLLRGSERVSVYPYEGQVTLLRTVQKGDGESGRPQRRRGFGPLRPRFV